MIAIPGPTMSAPNPKHFYHTRSRLRDLSDEDLLNAAHILEGDFNEMAQFFRFGLVSGRQFKKEFRRRGLQGEVSEIRKRGQALRKARQRLEAVKMGVGTR